MAFNFCVVRLCTADGDGNWDSLKRKQHFALQRGKEALCDVVPGCHGHDEPVSRVVAFRHLAGQDVAVLIGLLA